jgi:hypothetical protein
MSEDPTQNLEQKYDTKPTIETVLTEMRAGFAQLNARIDGLEQRMTARFDTLESRIDKVESIALITRGEMLELRADFRDFRNEVREKLKEPA